MTLDVLIADVSGWQSEDVSPLAQYGFKAVIPKYTEDVFSASGFKAHQQCASARAAGMSVFAGYDFGLGSNGRDQCDALLAAFAGDNIQRAVLDAEVNSVTPEIVIDFGRRAREWNASVKPLLYASTSFMQENYAGYDEIPKLFDGWIAAYTAGYDPITAPATRPPSSPPPFESYLGWQFTSVFPTSLGGIDASVFDSAVFQVDQKKAATSIKEPTMYIFHNTDVHDPADGEPKGEWVLGLETSCVNIHAGEAFGLAMHGVPWEDNCNTLRIIGECIIRAQAAKNLEFWKSKLPA